VHGTYRQYINNGEDLGLWRRREYEEWTNEENNDRETDMSDNINNVNKEWKKRQTEEWESIRKERKRRKTMRMIWVLNYIWKLKADRRQWVIYVYENVSKQAKTMKKVCER